MVELLLALLIFSLAMLGLWSGQMAGKRAGYDALQRTVATALARDMLERLRANPRHVQAYRGIALGGPDHRVPVPAVDCMLAECAGGELAAFDLWQWEALLLDGAGGRDGGGELVLPRACVGGEHGVVNVAISWLGLSSEGPGEVLPCATGGGAPESDIQSRHRLVLESRVDGWE